MGTARFSLLRILADGETHSLEQIGTALGLSPGEASELLGELGALGVPVVARGDARALAERLDLYDASTLAELVARASPALHLELLDECDSTNSVLAERASGGAAHGTVLTCEHQAAGRGRRGNAWVSAVGGSVAFSILWRFSLEARALAGLSLAVAVGAAEALEALGARDVAVKWPNDLLCGGRKLGGILIEITGEPAGPIAAIIGVGVNVRLGSAARAGIAMPVADLATGGAAQATRTAVLCGLLASIARTLEQFSREGFAPFRPAWLKRHAWQGRRVVLLNADRCLAEGEVVGVADDGALELSSAGGVQRFHSGELSLRAG